MPKAKSVVDVILGEAGGRTPFERLADMLNIASVIHNRAVTGRVSPEDVVSVQDEFNAYDEELPPGVEQMRSVAERVWAQVQRSGPVHHGAFYAMPNAVKNLSKGLRQIGSVNNGHVYFADPQGRSFRTAKGFVTPDNQLLGAMPDAPPVPTPRPEGSAAQPFRPTPDDAPIPTPRPQRSGGMPRVSPGYSDRASAGRGDFAPASADGIGAHGLDGIVTAASLPAETPALPAAGGLQARVPHVARAEAGGLGIAPPSRPKLVYAQAGRKRSERPSSGIEKKVEEAVAKVDPLVTTVLFSGQEPKGAPPAGTPYRHPLGYAGDFYFTRGESTKEDDRLTDPVLMHDIAMQMAADHDANIGYGNEYMGPGRLHIDTMPIGGPYPGGAQWKSGGKAWAGNLDFARATGIGPTPYVNAPVPTPRPTMPEPFAAAPAEPVQRTPLLPPEARPLPPERGWHQAAVEGMLPEYSPVTLPKTAPTPASRFSGVMPSPPISRSALPLRAAAPASAKRALATAPVVAAPRLPFAALPVRKEPARVANPMSPGPGGMTAGRGLSAISAVMSGRTAPGAVAHSTSNPGFSVMSLPGGKYARSSGKHGWSEVIGDEDDVLGFHPGKVMAVDPTGRTYKAVTPDEARGLAAKGWSISSTASRSAGKSAGPGKSGLPGLAGFLSGLLSPGPAPSKSLGQQAVGQAMGLMAGLLGPGGGLGGLGGGFSGGQAGGLGGHGNPGFGGGVSQNDNYGGL